MKAWIFCLLAAVTAFTCAQAGVVEYGGHYYELVKTGGTWDEINALANARSYNGYSGHLATWNNEAEYSFIKSNVGLDTWTIAAVGAYNDNGTYSWVNGEGAVNFSGWSTSPWSSGEPNSANYGTAMGGSGYSYRLGSYSATAGIGEFVVEYEAVPEPAGLALVAVGLVAVALRRRNCKS